VRIADVEVLRETVSDQVLALPNRENGEGFDYA
jgi:hypothetical protein